MFAVKLGFAETPSRKDALRTRSHFAKATWIALDCSSRAITGALTMQAVVPTPDEISRPPRAGLRRNPPLEIAHGILILSLCLFVLRKTAPSSFTPAVRQENRPLLQALAEFKEQIPEDARVYVLTQDPSPHNLLWRKACYGLIPRRTLCLPRNLRAVDAVPANAVNPESGSEATLGEMAAFTDPVAFSVYLRAMNVSHIVILSGDEPAALATGRRLSSDRMYLLTFDVKSSQLTEVFSAQRP